MNVCASVVAIALVLVGRAQAADCETVLGKYMVGQALLAANYVAAAEKAGMKPAEINAALKDIAAKSAIGEFCITDKWGEERQCVFLGAANLLSQNFRNFRVRS